MGTRIRWPPLLIALIVACFFLLHKDARVQSRTDKLTVVVTAFQLDGSRNRWLRKTTRQYLSPEYVDLVDQVVLVWNAPEHDPPADLPPGLTIIRPNVNSLNNRWTETLSSIRTDAVVNLDDDVSVNKDGLMCLFHYWENYPEQLIGPFVRRHENEDYIMDELIKVPGVPHSIVLPRVMILSKTALETYSHPDYGQARSYVDRQEAHCDDILLNAIISFTTDRAPLRIALPPGSITDYSAVCTPLDSASGGLADQSERYKLRTECLGNISRRFPYPPFRLDNQIGICPVSEHSVHFERKVLLQRWRAMAPATASSLCPELSNVKVQQDREGFGAELELYCPDTQPAMSKWLDSLAALPICGTQADEEELMMLHESAKYQCGSWCIWDLREKAVKGWYLTPTCLRPFTAGHSCEEWYYQRPKVSL